MPDVTPIWKLDVSKISWNINLGLIFIVPGYKKCIPDTKKAEK